MTTKKLKMRTADIAEANIQKIRDIFPDCVTEARDDFGNLKLFVDFDQLHQSLSRDIIEGPQERYRIDWPGKREAIVAANSPIEKTLRPTREESSDFDSTKNLFVEGDNLEALKLLQETYLGKIKMIYIDPPYNTGNDFVYRDNFTQEKEEFEHLAGGRDDDGGRLVSNSETNGRFHSDWLSMMYSRLKLAKHLLADEGIFFSSIDENERANLQKICDEIFGTENFLGCFVWKRRSGAMDAVSNLSEDHEYVLAYSKNKAPLKGVKRTFEKYKNPDNDPRGTWISDNLSAGKPGGDTYYPIVDPRTGNEFWPPKGRYWPYSQKTMAQKIQEGRVLFPKTPQGTPMLKRFASEALKPVLPVSSWIEKPSDKGNQSSISTPMNSAATKALMELLGGKLFSFPKPVELVKALLTQAAEPDSLVLDFFAGSATTAHAVMQLNAEDGGNRKFIMVQLPEETDEKSEAFKAGYKTIAEISKERIRRAGAKILEGECAEGWNRDVGFRVLKVDSSNMADVWYTPDETTQAGLLDAVDNIKQDRTGEDLLFQVLLDWGVDLTLPIVRQTIQGKEVFFVDDNALIACFENDITEALVTELATRTPLRVVFRDTGFADDATKINVEQIFRQTSPETDVKAI